MPNRLRKRLLLHTLLLTLLALIAISPPAIAQAPSPLAVGASCPSGPEVGSWTSDDPVFNRPHIAGGGCTLSAVGTAVYYDVYSYELTGLAPLQLFASLVDGTVVDSVMVFYQATDGSQHPFDPSQPCLNLVAFNDDAEEFIVLQSEITATDLSAGWVDVVIAPYNNDIMGAYTMQVSSSTCEPVGFPYRLYLPLVIR